MNLNINYAETRNVGSQLISKGNEFDQILNNVRNINAQIAQTWTGSDANKYITAVNEQMQYMRQLAMTIADIGNYLIRVSNAYENASQNNMNSINL